MDGAKKGTGHITLIEDSEDDSDQDVGNCDDELPCYDDLQDSDDEVDSIHHRDKDRESQTQESEPNNSQPYRSNLNKSIPNLSEPSESESHHLESNCSVLNGSEPNFWIPRTSFGDLFILPLHLLKALVYFYDSDEWADKIEGLSTRWYYATLEEEGKGRLILLNRVKRMLKSQRQETCITTILSLYFGADNISITNYLTPLRDAIKSCKAYVSHTLPLFLEKTRQKIETWQGSSRENSLSTLTPYSSLFECGTLDKDCTRDHKSMIGYATHGFNELCDQINERRFILTQLLKEVHPDQEQSTPISYPVWLPKCIALLPGASIHHLISHNCFHLFRNLHHTERDCDVMRSLLIVSSVDCCLSRMQEDKDRFKQIVILFNHSLHTDVMSNLFQSSDKSSRKDRARYQHAQQGMTCKDMTRIRLPLDHHILSLTSDDKRMTSPSMPHLTALENLFTPSTWETMEQSSIPKNIDRLTQITNDVCNWSKGFDSKSRCVIVDRGRQNVIRDEIKMMGEDSILNRAISIGHAYEVIRCFHISPMVVNYDGKDCTDLRFKGMETAKACILLIMLSVVRNVVFRSSGETNCNTVIITSRARDSYEKRQCDLNLEFGSSSCIVLSAGCLERVLTAIQKKEDIVI